jgi:PIN domain nuclease of toxin-antitoxin system
MISFLLDTHILVWWHLDSAKLSRAQTQVLEDLEEQGQPAGLSAISLRELAKMIQRGRLTVDMSLESWLAGIASHPLLTIFPLTPEIAADSVRLGDTFPGDPADQIIAATARHHGMKLLTADDRIRKSGKVAVV